MKKNKVMRAAGVLLIATLLSTSVVSGTYAKYVTSDSASDTAKVAKFGATITATGALFSDTYKTTTNTPGESGDSTGAATLSVVSSAITSATTDHDGTAGTAANKVVAPGTKNDDGLTFTVTGAPEVAVNIVVAVTDDTGAAFNAANKDIYLKGGTNVTFPDMTTGNGTDTFTNAATYYPIKYTLTQDTGSGSPTTLVNAGNLTAVKTALEALSAATVNANTNLATTIGTLNLTWAWDFDASGAGTYDKQDTLLGDLAAGTNLAPLTTLTAGDDYNLSTGVQIAITITQID